MGLPPALPTGLTTSATHEAVTLTWDDPGDDSITHYEVYRRVTGQDSLGDFDLIETDTGSAEAGYTDDDVSPETPYTYRVKAVNNGGVSLWSEDSSVTTPAAPEAAPDPDPASSAADLAPGGLAARVVYGPGAEPAGVELSWNAPAEDGRVGYRVRDPARQGRRRTGHPGGRHRVNRHVLHRRRRNGSGRELRLSSQGGEGAGAQPGVGGGQGVRSPARLFQRQPVAWSRAPSRPM